MASQIAAHAGEDAGLPQRQHGADDQDEVADQIEVDEAHSDFRRGWARDAGLADSLQSPAPSPQSLGYRRFTTSAARRLRRRVSSRALSYFGRSSP